MGNINEGASATNTTSTPTKATCVSNTLRRETGNENVKSPAALNPPAIHGQEATASVAPCATAYIGQINSNTNLNQYNHTLP